MAPQLEAELDRLFGLPLGEFTAARNELAKELRDAGRRDEAEQVKALRKPAVAAWLVNQLVRERELDMQRLLNSGETLRKAQADAKAESFAEARRDEQRALERLAAAAREIAVREGSGQAAVAQATQTLRAASLTDEGREQLKRGRFTEELEPPGFEALTGLVPAKPSKRRAKPRQPSKQARDRVEKLRKTEREAASAARAAEREADRAENEASKLRDRAAEARAKADSAAAKRAAAERELKA